VSFQFNDQEPLARCKGERQNANDALHDYYLMGSARSLSKLATQYRESTKPVPTRQLSRLKIWSTTFKWQDRIAQAKEQQNQAERERKREQRKQLLDGLLVKAAEGLQALDVRGASFGQVTNAVRTVVQELRAEYDDLPTQKQEISGAGGGPVQTVTTIDVRQLSDDELNTLGDIANRFGDAEPGEG